MLRLPWEYAVTISKLWGRAISGPVLAVVGLGLLIAQQTIANNVTANRVLKMGGWLTLGTAAILVLIAQYEVWKQEREARIQAEEELMRRLTPKAIIRNLTPRVWPADLVSFTGKEYYFDIFNSSETESLDNVRVEVAEIIPDAIGYPNAPLHVRNDDYETREFSINPASVRQIDLITGPVNDPKSQRLMIIAHTVNKERRPIPYGRYRITVRVSARNMPPVTAVFEAWIDEEKVLQCAAI
jgi:hypothetical protein